MSEPGLNAAAAVAPTLRAVAVDAVPMSGPGAAARPPLPLGAAPAAVSNRLVCWEPEARADWSLPQVSNSRETVASISVRTWAMAMAGAPARRASIFVPDLRTNLAIQPRSIQGAGGVCNGKRT